MFPIKPLQDRLIVMQAKTVTNKGSSIVQVSSNRPTEGTVIAVGPDVKGIKVNDYVLFADYSGQETPGATSQADGVPVILREHEIIALIDVAVVREMEEAAHARERQASDSLAAARQEFLAKQATVSITDG